MNSQDTGAEAPAATSTGATVGQMRAVTISREYGSGGGEIAARLAQKLGWQLIDHEIVVRVAKEWQVHESVVAEQDEIGESTLSRILSSLRMFQPISSVDVPVLPETDAQDYQASLRRVVMSAVEAGRVVIVGRGSQKLLADRRDTLHARIVASLEGRIAYVMEREGLDRNAARARIQLKDRDRARFLESVYHQSPATAELYDLVVNTDTLSLDDAVTLIAQALTLKGARLNIPANQLGPGAGLVAYTGRPGDFRPPEGIAADQKPEKSPHVASADAAGERTAGDAHGE